MSSLTVREATWRLNAEEITYLESVGSRMVRRPGHVFMREGESGDFALLIRKGHVKIESGKPARIVAFRGPNETVGEMAVIRGKPRSATVVAWDDVEVLHISAVELKKFLFKFTRAMYDLLEATDERVVQMTRLLMDSDLVAEQRLAKVLVELVESGLATASDDAPTIRMSQEDLASLTGFKPVSMKKIVRVFREHELIETGRLWLRIKNVSALKNIANGKPMESW